MLLAFHLIFINRAVLLSLMSPVSTSVPLLELKAVLQRSPARTWGTRGDPPTCAAQPSSRTEAQSAERGLFLARPFMAAVNTSIHLPVFSSSIQPLTQGRTRRRTSSWSRRGQKEERHPTTLPSSQKGLQHHHRPWRSLLWPPRLRQRVPTQAQLFHNHPSSSSVAPPPTPLQLQNPPQRRHRPKRRRSLEQLQPQWM